MTYEKEYSIPMVTIAPLIKLMLIGCIGVFFWSAWIHGPTIWDGSRMAWAMMIVLNSMILFFLHMLYGYTRVFARISLHADHLLGEDGYFRKKRIPYDAIQALFGHTGWNGTYFKIKTYGAAKAHWEFGPNLMEFGELMERLLPRLTHIEEITNLKKIAAARDADGHMWGKEPDWDIINAAIARAEENRKKKEKEQ